MENNRMVYKIGGDNAEYRQLLNNLKSSGTCKFIAELSNGWFYTYTAILNGITYKIMDDVENGIPYSIETI